MPLTQGIVEYFGVTGSEHKCGYCKGMRPANADYGTWAHQLKPLEYLLMMERGWRRSGRYCYHPIRSKTCCPPYSIRCDAKELRLSKSQRKCLKRVNRFLSDGSVPPADCHKDSPAHESVVQIVATNAVADLKMSYEDVTGAKETAGMRAASQSDSISQEQAVFRAAESHISPSPEAAIKCNQPAKDRSGKAKNKRIEKRIQKVMLRENCSRDVAASLMRAAQELKSMKSSKHQDLQQFSLESLLESSVNAKHKIEVKFVCTSFEQRQETSSKESAFLESVLPVEHAIYANYQMKVHGDEADECTKKQFKRFLVDTPLIFTPFKNSMSVSGIRGFGSYHMQYWLDNEKMIAVGIIDILPTGLSSVYLFYDPEYSFLGLGTYSALRELALVRQIMKHLPSFRYYYMGFYIHSCLKMRYKGKFLPSDLLCPEARTWHPIHAACKLLDNNKYSRLNPDDKVIDEEGRDVSDQLIGVLIAGQGVSNFLRYQIFKSDDPNMVSIEEKVRQYASLMGKKAVRTILIYLE